MTSAPAAASLLEAWRELAAVSAGDRLYRTRRLARPLQLDLRTGLRETDGAPCLIVAPGAADDRIAAFETAGLRLSRAADPGGVLIVLSLEEPARRDLFAEVCSDCIRSVLRGEDEGEADLVGVLAGRLSAWRTFLRDQAGGMSRHEIIGLIGELLILDRLLDYDSDAVSTWKSPDDGLQDFERGGHALEVKTALGGARELHISTLDQLDENGLGSLHVAQVRLVETADGETLAAIVLRIEERLAGERARGLFRNALLRRGLAPGGDSDRGPRVTASGIDAWRVGEGFPRLRRGDVALGISEAVYRVETRSLTAFAVDPAAILSTFGRAAGE